MVQLLGAGQPDAGPGLSGVSLGEACTTLDAILRKELPLAQDLAAGILSICAELRGDNPQAFLERPAREGMSVRTAIPRGGVLAVRRGESGIGPVVAQFAVFLGSRLTRVADRCLIYRGKDA